MVSGFKADVEDNAIDFGNFQAYNGKTGMEKFEGSLDKEEGEHLYGRNKSLIRRYRDKRAMRSRSRERKESKSGDGARDWLDNSREEKRGRDRTAVRDRETSTPTVTPRDSPRGGRGTSSESGNQRGTSSGAGNLGVVPRDVDLQGYRDPVNRDAPTREELQAEVARAMERAERRHRDEQATARCGSKSRDLA
jgi:hypothetical protein